MANKLKRYEAIVKLRNNAAVPYHNINTGLIKFHRFVTDKFGENWIFYTVRRIETKEIIGTFKNDTQIQVKSVRIFLPKQRNDSNTGFFIRVPFKRGIALINRNLFFVDKVILDYTLDYIVIQENIFKSAIQNAIDDLKAYYKDRGQIVTYEEIELSEFQIEKLLSTTKREEKGTQPLIDYP